MENIKNLSQNTVEVAQPHSINAPAKTKSYQDFINVLSKIIEKHGAEVLNELNSAE